MKNFYANALFACPWKKLSQAPVCVGEARVTYEANQPQEGPAHGPLTKEAADKADKEKQNAEIEYAQYALTNVLTNLERLELSNIDTTLISKIEATSLSLITNLGKKYTDEKSAEALKTARKAIESDTVKTPESRKAILNTLVRSLKEQSIPYNQQLADLYRTIGSQPADETQQLILNSIRQEYTAQGAPTVSPPTAPAQKQEPTETEDEDDGATPAESRKSPSAPSDTGRKNLAPPQPPASAPREAPPDKPARYFLAKGLDGKVTEDGLMQYLKTVPGVNLKTQQSRKNAVLALQNKIVADMKLPKGDALSDGVFGPETYRVLLAWEEKREGGNKAALEALLKGESPAPAPAPAPNSEATKEKLAATISPTILLEITKSPKASAQKYEEVKPEQLVLIQKKDAYTKFLELPANTVLTLTAESNLPVVLVAGKPMDQWGNKVAFEVKKPDGTATKVYGKDVELGDETTKQNYMKQANEHAYKLAVSQERSEQLYTRKVTFTGPAVLGDGTQISSGTQAIIRYRPGEKKNPYTVELDGKQKPISRDTVLRITRDDRFQSAKHFAVIKAATKVTAHLLKTGADRSFLQQIGAGSPVAVLGRAGNEYLIRSKNGMEGFVPASSLEEKSLVARNGKAIETVLTDVQKLYAASRASAAEAPASTVAAAPSAAPHTQTEPPPASLASALQAEPATPSAAERRAEAGHENGKAGS